MVAGCLLALAGCASAQEAQVEGAADRFATVVRDGDAAAACTLLAPDTRTRLEEQSGQDCAAALPGSGLGDPGARGEVVVAGHSAQARFADDTYFLALFDDGWKVTAAGCRHESGDAAQPYDCDVEGG